MNSNIIKIKLWEGGREAGGREGKDGYSDARKERKRKRKTTPHKTHVRDV